MNQVWAELGCIRAKWGWGNCFNLVATRRYTDTLCMACMINLYGASGCSTDFKCSSTPAKQVNITTLWPLIDLYICFLYPQCITQSKNQVSTSCSTPLVAVAESALGHSRHKLDFILDGDPACLVLGLGIASLLLYTITEMDDIFVMVWKLNWEN